MPKPIRITLPVDVVVAVDRLNANGGKTSLAVYIGEQVAALVQARQAKIKATLPAKSFVLDLGPDWKSRP